MLIETYYQSILFYQLHHYYFDQYDVRFGGESLVNRLRKGLTYQDLDSLLLRDDFLQREEIRQWVILKSINEEDIPKCEH